MPSAAGAAVVVAAGVSLARVRRVRTAVQRAEIERAGGARDRAAAGRVQQDIAASGGGGGIAVWRGRVVGGKAAVEAGEKIRASTHLRSYHRLRQHHHHNHHREQLKHHQKAAMAMRTLGIGRSLACRAGRVGFAQDVLRVRVRVFTPPWCLILVLTGWQAFTARSMATGADVISPSSSSSPSPSLGSALVSSLESMESMESMGSTSPLPH